MDRQKFVDFFFEASLNGWVGDAPEVLMDELPGFKVINYPRYGRPEMEGFFYRDAYSVHPETKISTGFTNIWHDGIPIFTSGYGGYYPKQAIPFLKEALRKAYLRKIFNGGRGVEYQNGGFEYIITGKRKLFAEEQARNLLKLKEHTQFDGIEAILDYRTGQVIGWHTIWCMTLF